MATERFPMWCARSGCVLNHEHPLPPELTHDAAYVAYDRSGEQAAKHASKRDTPEKDQKMAAAWRAAGNQCVRYRKEPVG